MNKLVLFFGLFLFLTLSISTASASPVLTPSGFNWATSAGSYPTGICVNDSFFWIVDSTDNEVYKYNRDGTYTTDHFDTAADGCTSPTGIVMNTTHLFIVDDNADEVFIYTIDGSYVSSWDTATAGCTSPTGITINASYFWIQDDLAGSAYKFDLDGTYTAESWWASANSDWSGITTNDYYFWVCDNVDDRIYRYYTNNTYSNVYTSLSHGDPQGITTNETYFWVVDSTADTVYEYFYNNLTTTPILISPSNNSVQTSSPITLSVLSTDADGDTITYSFYGGTSPGTMVFLGNNDNIGGNTFNWSIYLYDKYYWTASANDSYESSANMQTAQLTAIIPPLTTINFLNNSGFETWTTGPTSDPDEWTYSVGSYSIYREDSITYSGSYSARITATSPYGLLGQSVNATLLDYLDNSNVISAGAWVYATDPSVVSTYTLTSTGWMPSESHAGDSTWQWLTVSDIVTPAATSAGMGIYVDPGYIGYFDNAILVEGYDPAIEPYPTNGSTIYTTYPPLTYDVPFTWQDVAAPQYKLMVAEDENFNILAVNTHVGTDNSVHTLLVNKQYWWKVYSFDGTTYSDSSSVYNFILTGNSTLSGSAIEGVVYTDINGVNTALSGTEVTIWNETWTDTAITGSNGYYLFTDIADGKVYNVQAKKDLYLDSSVALVNATTDPITQDFYLLPDRTSEEWRHYVKFVVWGPAGYYEGVTITVYENSDVTALYTAQTGNDGAVTFIMDRQQEYRVTAINASQGINREMILYPKDEKYLFFVASTSSWTEHEDPQSDIIDIEISTEEINSTHTYINVSYTDSMSETSSWALYLNQSNSSDPYTQNTLQSTSGSTSSWNHSFVVDEYKGQGYWVNIKGVHTTYGAIDEQYSVMFEDEIGFDGIPQKAFLYIAILVMMFTGGMFGASTAPQGAMIICVEGWMFLFFGWFSTIDNNGIIAVGLGAATVVAIIANINQYSKKEGHE